MEMLFWMSGFRNLDILGGLRKDYQSYKIERKDNQKILTYSHGKKKELSKF